MRFSLRTLFVLVTLAAIVAAGFAWHPVPGIFIYLACFTLVASILRARAACRRIDAIRAAGGPPGSVGSLVVAAGVGVALAAAIAFCGMCSVAQSPFFALHATPERLPEVERTFARGLLVSIPVGTIAAVFVYTLTWPPLYREVPAKTDAARSAKE
jgi:hypothetical protein